MVHFSSSHWSCSILIVLVQNLSDICSTNSPCELTNYRPLREEEKIILDLRELMNMLKPLSRKRRRRASIFKISQCLPLFSTDVLSLLIGAFVLVVMDNWKHLPSQILFYANLISLCVHKLWTDILWHAF